MTKPIDRDALHRALFSRTNRQGLIILHQRLFADEVGWSYGTVYRIIKEFIEEERMRLVSTGHLQVKTYQVVDPVVWEARKNGTAVPEVATPKRVPQWG